VTNRLRIIVMS